MKKEIKNNLYKEYKDLKNISKMLLNSTLEDIEEINWDADLLVIEKKLEKYAEKIRNKWIEKVNLHYSKYYKSPPKSQSVHSIWGENIEYGYERSIEFNDFEQKIHYGVENFEGFTLTYSSAMTGFANLMIFFNDLYPNGFSISFSGGYFESVYSLELFQNMNNKIFLDVDEETVCKRYVEVIFLEPTRYNMLLETVDIVNIIKNIKTSDKLVFVIVDTTLMGESFPFENLLKEVSPKANIIFITFKSGLKLHQQGFELSNIGLLSFYYQQAIASIVEKIEKKLKAQRSIMGSNLSLFEYGLLNNNLFENSVLYTNNILDNTEKFAKELDDNHGDNIKKVIYPFNANIYQKLPFIYIVLNNNSNEYYKEFITRIKKNLKELNIDIYERNSFGFRNISYEYIETVDKNKYRVIKIAPGKIRGVKYYSLLNILIKLSNEDEKK